MISRKQFHDTVIVVCTNSQGILSFGSSFVLVLMFSKDNISGSFLLVFITTIVISGIFPSSQINNIYADFHITQTNLLQEVSSDDLISNITGKQSKENRYKQNPIKKNYDNRKKKTPFEGKKQNPITELKSATKSNQNREENQKGDIFKPTPHEKNPILSPRNHQI